MPTEPTSSARAVGEPRSVVVVARKVGRLANRLLLFAHFAGAALEHGLTVLNPAFGTYAHYFPSTDGDLLCRFPAGRRIPPFPGGRRLLYVAAVAAAEALYRLQARGRDVGLIRLSRDQHLDLNSDAFLDRVHGHRIVFVQDWFLRNGDNVARHRDAIRPYFTPRPALLARSHAVVERARGNNRLVVGVHVRRGDYAIYKGGRYFYSLEQYRGLMRNVEAAFPEREVAFIVCSDTRIPAGSFPGQDVVHGEGEQLLDLYTLAACDRLIGPPSTYTRWASYWGDVPLYRVYDPEAAPEPASFRVDIGLGPVSGQEPLEPGETTDPSRGP